MGQWTNRLYEYFREPESQSFSSKRLSASLRRHRQQVEVQVHPSRVAVADRDARC